MTQEDLEFLKENRSYLDQAYKFDYVRGIPMGLAQQFFDIADREKIHHGNISCHKCVYDVCKALGKILNENHSDDEKIQDNINTNQEEEIISEVIESSPKKTRKKKSTSK